MHLDVQFTIRKVGFFKRSEMVHERLKDHEMVQERWEGWECSKEVDIAAYQFHMLLLYILFAFSSTQSIYSVDTIVLSTVQT